MLLGNPATAVCFQEPSGISSLLPSDLDGTTPPPVDEPNFFLSIADSGNLNIFRFRVDFENPSSSTFTGPTLISVVTVQ